MGVDFSMRPGERAARLMATAHRDAALALGVVEPGMRVVGITKGQFSLIDLLSAVLKQLGPSAVLVSTWTPGKAEMERVADMLDSHTITDFRLLVDRSFVTRHPEYVERVQAILGAGAIRQTRTHAKFALVAGGDYRITIRTSMNFNRNSRFEQFDLDDDPDIYAFFEQVVESLYLSVPAGLDVPSSVAVRAFSGFVFRGLKNNDDSVDLAEDFEVDALLAEFGGENDD